MNEVQAERMAENVALGESLLQCLAYLYGCEPIESEIKKYVYKNSDCGPWIEFTEKGIRLGCIVEGLDGDGCSSHNINYNGDNESFIKQFKEAINEIEIEHDFLFDYWSFRMGF